ncbi:MAG: RNB domain-containing ribonuclease, partial [Bacillota bacterium]|nr:RNB domain-containing ribonuclease [Bacillota bacterium]
MEQMDIMQARKERMLAYIRSEGYIPMKRKDLRLMLEVPVEDRPAFEELLQQLIDEGQLFETRKGKLASPKDLQMATGTFIGHARGFGFVSPDEGGEDVFIPASETMGAMQKDKVLYKVLHRAEKGKKADGVIVRILERGMQRIVGSFEAGSKGYGFVVADDKKIAKDIFISREHTKGAVSGHKVVVEITDYGEDRRNPEGRVIEILGHVNDPGVDILSVIRRYELAVEFPEEVYREIETLETEVKEADKIGREDIRDWLTITIDGEDAKDLDDAVTMKKLGNGNYELGVHIADVSHYVAEGTALDREAYSRATSVYLVDRVIPMLPHKLSNGICSLNPHAD